MTRRRLLVAAALVVVVGGIVLVVTRGGNPYVSEASAVLADDERFSTASAASSAFGRVARLMLDAGDDCEEGCDRFFTAAAVAQVAAVRLLDCTRPGIFEARVAMRDYVVALDDADEPRPPPAPGC